MHGVHVITFDIRLKAAACKLAKLRYTVRLSALHIHIKAFPVGLHKGGSKPISGKSTRRISIVTGPEGCCERV
jgi:hypothetical protein